MEIAVQVDFAALESFSDHLLDGVAFWEKFGTRIDVLSIEVMTRETTAVIADDDSVWVEHWHNFENVAVTKYDGCSVVAD
jgi:hypothetical protein